MIERTANKAILPARAPGAAGEDRHATVACPCARCQRVFTVPAEFAGYDIICGACLIALEQQTPPAPTSDPHG